MHFIFTVSTSYEFLTLQLRVLGCKIIAMPLNVNPIHAQISVRSWDPGKRTSLKRSPNQIIAQPWKPNQIISQLCKSNHIISEHNQTNAHPRRLYWEHSRHEEACNHGHQNPIWHRLDRIQSRILEYSRYLYIPQRMQSKYYWFSTYLEMRNVVVLYARWRRIQNYQLRSYISLYYVTKL